jgi:hypothetical protein
MMRGLWLWDNKSSWEKPLTSGADTDTFQKKFLFLNPAKSSLNEHFGVSVDAFVVKYVPSL